MGLLHRKSTAEHLFSLPAITTVTRVRNAGSIRYAATQAAENNYLLAMTDFEPVKAELGDVLPVTHGVTVLLTGVNETEYFLKTAASVVHRSAAGIRLRSRETVQTSSQQRKLALVAMQGCYDEVYRTRRELRDQHDYAEDYAFAAASDVAEFLSPDVLVDSELERSTQWLQRIDKRF